MANYVKSTNFTVKDSLASGNPAKIVKGTEIDTEFNAIASAVASKIEADSPTLTGTPLAPTASTATNNTQIASTAYVVNRIAQDIAGKANIASPTFTGTPAAPTAAGGTNTTQVATTAFVTDAISTERTTERTATATLTNKTISGASNTLTVRLDQSDTTGTLPVSKGGTGATTHTANNVLVGNGTSAITSIAPGTSGNALVSNGTTWSSGSPAKLSTASGSAPSYSARAWVNFNGTGTPAIRASGNVSSITDNGTGDYTVNFSTAMSDADYSTIVTGSNWSDAVQAYIGFEGMNIVSYASGKNTSNVRVGFNNTAAYNDPISANVAIFR